MINYTITLWCWWLKNFKSPANKTAVSIYRIFNSPAKCSLPFFCERRYENSVHVHLSCSVIHIVVLNKNLSKSSLQPKIVQRNAHLKKKYIPIIKWRKKVIFGGKVLELIDQVTNRCRVEILMLRSRDTFKQAYP